MRKETTMGPLSSDGRNPVLALAIGDPAGVGPELAAKALAGPEYPRRRRPYRGW